MQSKAKILREELDDLGYYQCFTPESIPLIEKLVADLKTTTESLQKYMKIAQNAIEERDNLQEGAEPYKCDNARLVKECNDLHLSFMLFKEQNDKIQKDLKRRLEALKSENVDLDSKNEKLKNRIKQLEIELVDRGEILLGSKKQKSKPTLKSQSTSALTSARKSKNLEINSTMALADQKIANITKDLKKYKDHNLQLIEANELLQSQLNNRDQEIKRLTDLLEGGRSLKAVKKDCCHTESHNGISILQEEMNKIMQEKHVLENRLKEALTKQHEAMKRALHLAERNKILEKEMKDIDHLALAVEAECNNTVKNNTEKVSRLQDRIHESVLQIQSLERENVQLKQEKQELMAELDAIKVEKRHLQNVLETSLEEKKRLTDRINNFTIIEHDLNMEIDRLNRISAEQKRKIAELECSLVSEKVDKVDKTVETDAHPPQKRGSRIVNRLSSPEMSPTKAKTKAKSKKTCTKKVTKNHSSEPVRGSMLQVPVNTPQDVLSSGKCTCHCGECQSVLHLKDLLNKELEYREQQAQQGIDNLRSEKEYYMKEYHKMLEKLKNVNSRSSSSSKSEKPADLMQKLAEMERIISQLEQENKILSKEKFNLLSRLESARDMTDMGGEGPCLKVTCKRTERERDLLRADLERLEEERDALKSKIKNISESQVGESDRLQRRLLQSEEEIHKLEQDRRELLQSQGSKNAMIDSLQEQTDVLKDQLRMTQSELNQQRAMYTQLKTLHEQTDRSLADTQNKLLQAEAELANSLDNLKKRDLDRGTVTREVDMLKNDIEIMKTQLAQVDQEKDELLVALDDKTEKIAMLEQELRAKDKSIASLESIGNDLRKKLSIVVDENSSQNHIIRSSETEVAALRQEIDTIKKIKDSAIQENRRLQDDLAAVTSDCRDSRKELELYKRQVDDLKTQLQQYVAEVKRFEDLISNKEIERNELLDQFRSLSQEANILENNNHTLENEATQSRVQLSVALDHASDLERKLENKDSIIRSYEKQIGDLTSQIASLEIQLRQCMSQYDRCEDELQKMRDLSLKLDNENTKFRRQLRDREDQRTQLDRNVDQLRNEREFLEHTAARDRRNVQSVEKDLDDAKHETSELRMLNQDLQEELQRMKSEIQELKDKFLLTSEQLDMYQEKALEYSQQNKQLRREIANERFRRTRDSECSKVGCFCTQKHKIPTVKEDEEKNHCVFVRGEKLEDNLETNTERTGSLTIPIEHLSRQPSVSSRLSQQGEKSGSLDYISKTFQENLDTSHFDRKDSLEQPEETPASISNVHRSISKMSLERLNFLLKKNDSHSMLLTDENQAAPEQITRSDTKLQEENTNILPFDENDLISLMLERRNTDYSSYHTFKTNSKNRPSVSTRDTWGASLQKAEEMINIPIPVSNTLQNKSNSSQSVTLIKKVDDIVFPSDVINFYSKTGSSQAFRTPSRSATDKSTTPEERTSEEVLNPAENDKTKSSKSRSFTRPKNDKNNSRIRNSKQEKNKFNNFDFQSKPGSKRAEKNMADCCISQNGKVPSCCGGLNTIERINTSGSQRGTELVGNNNTVAEFTFGQNGGRKIYQVPKSSEGARHPKKVPSFAIDMRKIHLERKLPDVKEIQEEEEGESEEDEVKNPRRGCKSGL